MVDKVFGQRYKILEKIGSGGMANVYKGEDSVLNRIVAIKILHEQFSSDQSFIARFKQEAQSAANLTHPNVVSIFDWGKEDNSHYIVMEYLKGQNLKDYITDAGHLTWQETADIGSKVSNALGFAHKNDVIHRDIKPHNIVLTRDGSVKVTDFGIARAGASTMTQTGAILGTAHYISPEQAKGQTADARSDLYSLGIVMYEMLAGQPPYGGDNPVGIAMKHVQEPVPLITEVNPNVPDSLVSIINKALAKEPEERYQVASDLKQDLDAAMKGLPIKADVGSEQQTVIIKPKTNNAPRRTQRSKSKPAPKTAQKRKIWPVLALFSAIALIAIGWTIMSTGATNRIEVPEVTGMKLEKAKEVLKKEKLAIKIESREYSESVKRGLIIDQSPESGALLEENGSVKVIISKGIETVTVPSLYGKTRGEAESALASVGLELGEVSYKESDGEAGIVVSQSEKVAGEIRKDATVDIVLSKEMAKVTVVSVIGRSRKNAIVILATKSLKGSVVEKFDDDIDKGLVISQSPAAGSEVEKNSTVTIYVSKGPKIKKVSVPDVVGISLADATNAIQSAGLKISSSGSGATVTNQDPAAGSSVDENSTVTVTLEGM